MKKCKNKNCNRKSRSNGFCGMHYNRLRRYGRTTTIREKYEYNSICKVPNCNNYPKAKGYCIRHYAQTRRKGKVQYTRNDPYKIKMCNNYVKVWITNKIITLVDIEDFDRMKIFNWTISRGYLGHQKYGKLHNFILRYAPTKTHTVDHKNHNKLDNRKENLRVVPCWVNSMNRKNCIGAYYKNNIKKWGAKITCNKKTYYLGFFKNKRDAIKEYKKKKLEILSRY